MNRISDSNQRGTNTHSERTAPASCGGINFLGGTLLNFWKMSGSGNDFVVMDNRSPNIPPEACAAFVAKVCRRGLSVGADGVIFIESSTKADYKWRFFNADGSEAEMCGNGSRCAARFAYLHGIAKKKQTMETMHGIVRLDITGEGERVRVSLDPPSDMRLNQVIEIEGQSRTGHFINTGVPHFICIEEDVSRVDVFQLGRQIRHHPTFHPAGTNVDFVQVIDKQHLTIRTYERGVENETLACGTGALAASVITTALGKTKPPITVQTQSGIPLGVDFTGEGSSLSLEGDARIIFKGELCEEALL